MTRDYKTILYGLGAVPLSEAKRSFPKSETDQALYHKDKRVDVNGWLSPYWARREGALRDAKKEGYVSPRGPLSYSEYVSLLDVDEYRKTKDPLLYAVMAFTLDEMLMKGAKIENCEEIIKVYEAHIGLEDRALPLLKGCVSSDQAMMLYDRYGDANLLEAFPAPRPEEGKYIQFLQTVADKELSRGWRAFYLIYNMDKARYKEEFRDFLIAHIPGVKSLQDRIGMYKALLEIGDDISFKFLAEALLNDPVTEGREAIINAALTENKCPQELIKSMVQLSEGLGDKHDPVTKSRMVDQWHHVLRNYLTWAKDSNLCDLDTRKEAEKGLNLLK